MKTTARFFKLCLEQLIGLAGGLELPAAILELPAAILELPAAILELLAAILELLAAILELRLHLLNRGSSASLLRAALFGGPCVCLCLALHRLGCVCFVAVSLT